MQLYTLGQNCGTLRQRSRCKVSCVLVHTGRQVMLPLVLLVSIVAVTCSAAPVQLGAASIPDVRSITWSRSSDRIAAFHYDGVSIYDESLAVVGTIRCRLHPQGLPKSSPSITFCESDSPRRIQVWSWDLASSRTLPLPGSGTCPQCAVAVADLPESNSLLLVGLQTIGTGGLFQLNGTTGAPIRKLADATDSHLLRIGLYPGVFGVLNDRLNLASASYGIEINWWPQRREDNARSLSVPESARDRINDWDLSPDGLSIAYGKGGRVRLPRVGEVSFQSGLIFYRETAESEHDSIHRMKPFGDDPVLAVSWHPSGTKLAVSSLTGIAIIDVSAYQVVHTIQVDTPVNLLAYSPDGQKLAAYSYPISMLKIWSNLP